MPNVTRPRIAFFAYIFIVAFAGLEWRLIHLQVLRHDELEQKAENYRHMDRVEQSWRGQIRASNGSRLALSVPVKNIYADLEVWSNRVESLAPIAARLLHDDPARIAQTVHQALHTRHPATNHEAGAVLLKRGIAPTEWTAIHESLVRDTFGFHTNHLSTKQRASLKALRRWTLYPTDDQRRYYPCGETLGPVLGFVGSGTNGHLLEGKWGLEASLDRWLAGENGLAISSQDAAGNELAFSRTTDQKARDGANITLTIDVSLQQFAEEAVSNAVARSHALSGSCVVINSATGEILALVSQPSFSPQQPAGGSVTNWRNHAMSDRNEVGSVFKPVTLATALDLGVVSLDDKIDCHNGSWTYQKSTLHDDGHHYGWLTGRECLAKSSNIGLAQIGLRVGANRLYDSIVRFGFGNPTGVPLPYETSGFLRNPTNWSGISITRISIGHELGVSQLQLALAYAALANDGVRMKPMLIRELGHPDGTVWQRFQPQSVCRVVRPETARLILDAMMDVVEDGTGKAALIPGYEVVGKTGTAQKSDGHRYIPGKDYCSFVGIIGKNPKLVIAVAIDEPKESAYGGLIAAPVFRQIAERAIMLYNIPPDRLEPSPHPVIPVRYREGRRELLALRQ